jgi:hypothetical protein
MKKSFLLIGLGILALFILPTLTPEDFVNIPLWVSLLGWNGYILLCLVFIAVVWFLVGNPYKLIRGLLKC